MLPFARQTVTLYHRERAQDGAGRTSETWTRHVLTGCSWRPRARDRLSDSDALRGATVVCRIPPDQQRPAPGDVMLPGEVDAAPETAAEVSALLLASDGGFRVRSVADNTGPGIPLPHFAARGEDES